MLAAVDRNRSGVVAAPLLRARARVLRRGKGLLHETFDFVNHVALVAEIDEGGKPAIVGGGRYIVGHPGEAEVAFVVIDADQGQGIGASLTRTWRSWRARRA